MDRESERMALNFTPHQLLSDLVALPGPPGQEGAVREYVAARAHEMGCVTQTDAKGNLLIATGSELPTDPTVVVTAHLDEIALMVHAIDADGALRVGSMGGAFAWKWGEGPVEILAESGTLVPGVLSIGGIHTSSPLSTAFQARSGAAPDWSGVRIVTGLEPDELTAQGVRRERASL